MSDSIFDKPLEIPHNDPDVTPNWQEFMTVVRSRRSVRVFETSQKISDQDMQDVFEAALLAPNSSNLQPWEFYRVRSPEKKQKLIEACFSQPAASTAAELIVCVARTDTWKRNSDLMMQEFEKQGSVPKSVRNYYTKLIPMLYPQGFLNSLGFIKRITFFVTGFFRPVPRGPFSKKDLASMAMKTSALACENLMLALRAKGYDSCPMEGFDSHRVKKILNLGSGAHITMVIGAGKRTKQGIYGSRIRFDSKLFLFDI